jgi:hypothetical protein
VTANNDTLAIAHHRQLYADGSKLRNLSEPGAVARVLSVLVMGLANKLR